MKEFVKQAVEDFNELSPLKQTIVQILLILIFGSLTLWFVDSVIF